MAWDEEVYGREYDLAVFNIVAVADFNFGAMENKGLNIFNSRYILADPDTATDADYDAVAGVVAHEYFHNWSGNRVTCRDWFQLSPEGRLHRLPRPAASRPTWARRAVKRIEDVRVLRAAQFPEDAGPLAHPVRPDSYIEISNFYTATIYNKGAELIRMMHTILGPEKFRAGCRPLFRAPRRRGGDLRGFRLRDGGGERRRPRPVPRSGTARPARRGSRRRSRRDGDRARADARAGDAADAGPAGQAADADPAEARFVRRATAARSSPSSWSCSTGASRRSSFDGHRRAAGAVDQPRFLGADRASRPTAAPADLAFLSAHDDDPFARYEAMQQLMLDTLLGAIATGEPISTSR